MAYTNRNITRRGGIGRPGTGLRKAGGGRPRYFKSRGTRKKASDEDEGAKLTSDNRSDRSYTPGTEKQIFRPKSQRSYTPGTEKQIFRPKSQRSYTPGTEKQMFGSGARKGTPNTKSQRSYTPGTEKRMFGAGGSKGSRGPEGPSDALFPKDKEETKTKTRRQRRLIGRGGFNRRG